MAAAKFPFWQSGQVVPRPGMSFYFPLAHTLHCVSATAPVESRYFPWPHNVHVPCPAPAEYLPTWHIVQTDVSSPVAPLLVCFPAGQSEQVAEAVPLYWPAEQSEQTEDSSPVTPLLMCFPAGQLQMERSENSGGGCVCELNCQKCCLF